MLHIFEVEINYKKCTSHMCKGQQMFTKLTYPGNKNSY